MDTSFSDIDGTHMHTALKVARDAGDLDEVPIGAVIVNADTGEVIASAGNRTRALNDPTAHAEILAIRQACETVGSQRIPSHDLYVTLEPCTMCAAAISFARIRRVIIGALDEKGGGVFNGAKFYEQPTCHHKPSVGHGLLQDESAILLKEFFKEKRRLKIHNT